MTTQVEALIKRNIFASEEEALQELVRDYVLRQMSVFQEEALQFERKYGMNFQQFSQYLHERSIMLENKALPFCVGTTRKNSDENEVNYARELH